MTQNAILKVIFSCLLLGLTACGSGAELDVKLLRATEVSDAFADPFQRVTTLQFRVFDADTREIVQDASANLDDGEVSLGDLPTGRPLKIRAIGYAGSEVISWGESARFELPEGRSSETISTSIALRKVDTWSPVLRREGEKTVLATLNKQRAAHSATLLDDGRVLIVGGFQNSEREPSYVASIEILDPASGSSVRIDGEEARRAYHTAIRLQNGTILVSGGESGSLQASGAIKPYTRDDSLLFDQATLGWSSTAALPRFNQPRARHQALLLGTGSVLFFGGLSDSQDSFATPGDALYRPDQQRVIDGSAGGRVGHAMASLHNGAYQVVSGGKLPDGTLADTLLIFNSTGAQELDGTRADNPRLYPALLSHGSGVFALGGFDAAGAPLATTKFTQLLGGVAEPEYVSSNLSVARGQLCAVALKDGAILAVGGRTASGASSASDLFKEASNGLSASFVSDMSTARYLHTCTLLDNGMLLVTGGIDASGQATQAIEIFTPKPIDYPEWQ